MSHFDAAALALRLGLAAAYLPTALYKIATWERTVGFFREVGAPLPAVTATLNMGVEALAAGLLLAGVRNRLAAWMLVADALLILTPINLKLGAGLEWWSSLALRVAPAIALVLLGSGAWRIAPTRDRGDALCRHL